MAIALLAYCIALTVAIVALVCRVFQLTAYCAHLSERMSAFDVAEIEQEVRTELWTVRQEFEDRYRRAKH